MARIHPLDDPRNQLDRELLWIHRPGQRIVGEGLGGLVYYLGISTDRRYPINVEYDSRGFRNDHEIKQAPVVVIGDSFLDWPIIPNAGMVSTYLSQLLQVEVANLGQYAYGPQQELAVLRRYGLPLHPKIVLWFFFEGNDLGDVGAYEQASRNWDAIVKDKEWGGFRKRSFTKNALLSLAGLTAPGGEAHRRSCKYRESRSEEGKSLYFYYTGFPLSREDLANLKTAQRIFREAKELSAHHGARFLFVYIPTKFRVYADFCEFPEDGYGRDWQLNGLPSRLESWCQAQEIPFLDLTPILKKAAADGEPVFFPDDNHWNAKGNALAAESIASFLEVNGWLAEDGSAELNRAGK